MAAPYTFVSGDVLTAAQVNTYLVNNAWASYTPTVGGTLTEGNGTKTASYAQQGLLVFFRIRFIFGTTSSLSAGVPTFTLPVTARNVIPYGSVEVLYKDASAASSSVSWTLGFGEFTSTTVLSIYRTAAGGSYVDSGELSSTIPFTWTTSDEIRIAGWYEAA